MNNQDSKALRERYRAAFDAMTTEQQAAEIALLMLRFMPQVVAKVMDARTIEEGFIDEDSI